MDQEKLIPQIRPKVPGLGKKGEQPPALQKSLTQELLYEKYPQHSWIHAYTDGSAEKAVRYGGSGIYIKFPYKPPTSLSFPVGKQSSNYIAELQALIKATQYLIETREQDRSIVILTDHSRRYRHYHLDPLNHHLNNFRITAEFCLRKTM